MCIGGQMRLVGLTCALTFSCNSDSSFKYLEAKDSIAVTPNRLVVTPPPADGVAVHEQTLTVRASRDGGHPAEGYHVDVELVHSASSANSALPPTDFVVLDAASNHEECSRVSDGAVHCVLSVNGTATFAVRGKAGFVSDLQVKATSGEAPAHSAKVYAGSLLPDAATLVFAPSDIRLRAKAISLACGTSQEVGVCDASQLARSTPFVVQVQQDPPKAFADAQVALSISTTGSTGVAWLAKEETCPKLPFNTIYSTMSGVTGVTDRVYLCSDATDGSFSLAATALSGSHTAMANVVVDPQPARVRAVGSAVFNKASGQVSASLRVTDCREQPVKEIDVAVGLLSSSSQPVITKTNADGQTSVSFAADATVTAPDAQFVFLSVALPESSSACRTPVAFSLEVAP